MRGNRPTGLDQPNRTQNEGNTKRWHFRCALAVTLLGILPVSGFCGQDRVPESGQRTEDPELSVVLERTAAGVRQFAADLQHLAWTSVVRYETLDKKGRRVETDKPREVTYETIARLRGSNVVPSAESQLKLVDGKPVKPNYKLPWNYAPPTVGLPVFLLPEFRGNYSFSYSGHGDLRGRDVLMLDVVYPPEEKVPRVLWGRERYVLSVAGLPTTGTLWIDPGTFDVLQIEMRAGPVEIAQGDRTKDRLRYERTWMIKYRSMTFEDPAQVVVVPESYEVVTLLDGASPALRREVHTFLDFKRFIGDVRTTPVNK